MYPQGELTRLAAHKAVLQRNIAYRRADCARAASRLARPLAWLDRALAFWRSLSPLTRIIAVPLGALVQRTLFRRMKSVGMLLRWAPMIIAAVRGIGLVTTPRTRGSSSFKSSRG